MDNQKKDVGKALGTNDIRALAPNWTLAGDVGLLAHLEQFSEHIVKKTQETQASINELLSSYEETSTTINNVTNQFLALQNSQFVENRVYDDETPTDEKKIETKELNKEEEERLMLARYKEAVEKGVKLLDTHFEEVQLPPSSDSDEEDFSSGNGALVWRPKNPYSSKRFPLLIGSAEWWADDNVGLGDYEENIDSERVLSESDSDMEAERNVEKRIRMSSSSSMESESGMNKKLKVPQSSSGYDDIFRSGDNDIFENSPNLFLKKGEDLFEEPENIFEERENISSVQNHVDDHFDKNTFQEKIQKDSLFDDEVEEEIEQPKEIQPASVKQKKMENAFTKELAAKLGTVASKQMENPKPETPQVPVKTKSDNKLPSALLDDDENDDLFSTKITPLAPAVKKKNNLFSDIDDDQLFGGSNSFFSNNDGKGLFDNDFSSLTKSSVSNTSQAVSDVKNTKSAVPTSGSLFDGDLFGDVDDDDTLFSSSKPAIVQPQNSQSLIRENKNSPKVKFSTPSDPRGGSLTLGGTDDLFGTLSAVLSNDDSNANASDGSLNAARLLDDELTQDLGYSEQSHGDISHNRSLKLQAEESPDLFRPQLSSTRRISNETSDYKTQKIFSDTDHHTDSSNMPHSQENSKDKMGHNEKAHFSRAQSESSKTKGLFEEDEDDLFTSETSKPSKSIFEDDILSNSKPNAPLFKKTDLGLFEDDDNSLFVDSAKQPDSISVSSSRSSLFDDVSVGKSTLASVFDKDKSSKLSDDLFGDDRLFGGKKVNNDLFTSTENKTKEKGKSLFSDLEDSEDLFSSSGSKILFSGNDKTDDLFGGKSVGKEDDDNLFKKPVSIPSKPKSMPREEKSETDDDNLFGKTINVTPKPLSVHKDKKPEPDLSSKPLNKPSEPLSLPKDENLFKKPIRVPPKPASVHKDEMPALDDDNLFSKPLVKPLGLPKEGKSETDDDNLFGEAVSIPKKPLNLLKEEISEPDDDNLFKKPIIVSPKPSNVLKEEKSERNDENLFKKPVIVSPKPSNVQKEEIPERDDENLFEKPVIVSPKPSNVQKEEKSEREDEKLFKKPLIITPKPSNVVKDEKTDDNLFVKPFTPPKNEKPRTDNDNLFEKPVSQPPKPLPKPISHPVKPSSLFNDLDEEDNLFSSEKPLVAKIKPDKKPEPPKSLNIKNVVDVSEVDGGVISAVKPKKIGKLNIPSNLNINPTALLPGAKSQKKEEKIIPNIDQPVDTPPNLLKCTNKDRVKIQGRRPQSRRARQEALRKSGIDFGTDETDNLKNDSLVENAAGESSSSFHSVENSPETLFSSPLPSNPLSPSTDEEDYFNVPELDVNFEKEDQSIFKSNLNNSKSNANKSDDNLLFDGAPVLSPVDSSKDIIKTIESDNKSPKNDLFSNVADISSKLKKQKIFDDDDDDVDSEDDSLFKNTETLFSKKQEAKNDNLFTKSKPKPIVSKNTLFDDSPSDDLFGEKSTNPPPVNKPQTQKEATNKNFLKKPVLDKTKDSFVDPLGLMSNPD